MKTLLNFIKVGLTGLTGLSGLSGLSASSSEQGSGQRSARSDSRTSNDSFTSNSERGGFLEGEGSEYGDVEDTEDGPKVDAKKLEAHGGHFLRDVLSYYLLIDKHPQKDYTRAELKFFIESVKVFVSSQFHSLSPFFFFLFFF
jgi:hypothetical protein